MTQLESIEYLEAQNGIDSKTEDSVPYEDFLGELNAVETRNGLRNYSLVCAASKDINGNVIFVLKDDETDSKDPTDWLVARCYSESQDIVFDTVLACKTTNQEYGDYIELELASDVSHHGPYKLSFSVDSMYQRDGSPVVISHQKYYGRGVGETPEHHIDYEFAVLIGSITIGVNSEIDNIVDLETERAKRRNVGYTAIAGF